MKNTFFLCLIAIMFTSSCKKDDCLEIQDIVNTDGDGNILNPGNSNDWTPMNINEHPAFQGLPLQPPPVPTTSGVYEASYPELPEGIILDCPITESISFILYPNPVIFDVTPKLKITSLDKKFIDFAISYSAINGSVSGGASGLSSTVLTNGGYTILAEYPEGQTGWPGPDNNVQLYLYVMTEDSCAYFTEGKIMYVK